MSGSTQNLPPLAASAEERARALIAQEKWRQARDELKALIKTDRARFLPLLVEANLGLARKMLAGGQSAEARQVVNYLATLVPADQLRVIELELAVKAGASENTLPKFIAALTDAPDALSGADRVRLADWVVLSFQPVAVGQPPSPARERLAAEVRTVHEALRAVAEARWPEVAELLRLVPHRSVVSHWAVFIKGIAVFHTGGNDKANKLLGSLPAESAPARAAQAYLLLTGETTGLAATTTPPPAAAVLEGVCRLAGAPGVSEILMRADRLWREGKHAESYRALREAVPAFPSTAPDGIGALTEFYFKAPHDLGEDARFRFVRPFCNWIDREQFKNGTEAMHANRLLALLGQMIAPVPELRFHWEEFLRQHQAIRGKNPRLASLAYGWLGEQLAMMRDPPGSYYGGVRLRDAAGAEAALLRSIELDRGNLPAHLTLCAVYDAQKKNSERNRLLDDMTARFPDDKQVLVRAARGCIDRSAFGKGLDYLARARQLDQLDPRIPEFTVVALQQQARQQFQQGRADRARQTLARTEDWLTEKADDFQRSRWSALARHGVMERIWGDPTRSATLLVAAAGCAPSPAVPWLFAHLAHRNYTKCYVCSSPYLAELKPALRRAPRIGDLGVALRLLAYWREMPERHRTRDEDRLVAGVIETASKQPFTRAEAIRLIEGARDNYELSRPIEKLVSKVLRGDPLDPRFRLWKWGVGVTGAWSSPGSRAELQGILDEAVRRHDEPAMRQARQLLRDLDHPAPPLLPSPFGPPDFLTGDGEDDEEFDDDDAILSGMPPKTDAGIAELLEIIRRSPASETRDLRRKIAGKIPGHIFDMIVEAAKKGIMPSLPPMPPPRRPNPPSPRPVSPLKPARPAPPAPDPNQLDLF